DGGAAEAEPDAVAPRRLGARRDALARDGDVSDPSRDGGRERAGDRFLRASGDGARQLGACGGAERRALRQQRDSASALEPPLVAAGCGRGGGEGSARGAPTSTERNRGDALRRRRGRGG